MTTKELLISRLNLLSEEDIASLLDAATHMEEKNTLAVKPDCPYCGSQAVIRYGYKCRKQRFLCKSCAKTFVTTTHTIMSNSHFPAEAWREVINDTVHGNAIDYTAQRIGCSHQAVFDMRHKVLMALQQLPEINGVCLGEVSEFDETFVLDCYKGKKIDSSIPKGENKTIGSAGCGVTAAAMVIATLKDKNVTPVTTAEWSMAHGYKALNQGTYYTYFVPQFKQYGITCRQLNSSNLYGKSSSSSHTEALNALKNGNWVIAVMGKGHWTSAGHFILLYKYENGYVYINDPASTKADRIKNTWDLFAKQVKYMWVVDVPKSSTSVPINNVTSSGYTGMVVNCKKLNMRKEAITTVNNIINVLDVNEKVEIIGRAANGWYKVKTKDNLVGYASNKYITIL